MNSKIGHRDGRLIVETYEFRLEPLFARSFNFAGPPNLVKEKSEGFLLTERAEMEVWKSMIFSFVGWLLILTLLIIAKLFSVWLFLFSLLLIWLGIIFVFLLSSYRTRFITRFRCGRGELILPSPTLHLGGEFVLTFRRRLRREKKTRYPGQLILRIACVERIQYEKGSSLKTRIHVVWQSKSLVRDIPAGVSSLLLETAFTVPSQLPSSFEGNHNQIRWIVSVEQKVPGLVNHVYSNFTFVVDPVVVA